MAPSPLETFWPLTRAMVLVEAPVAAVAKACFDFHRTRYVHPSDKVTRYTLTEFGFTDLAAALGRLVPVASSGYATRLLVLPARGVTVVIQNNANVMAFDVIKRLKAKHYLIRCDGALSRELPTRRHWGLYLSRSGATINALLVGEEPPSGRALLPHEVKGKQQAAKVFGFKAPPAPFTDAHVLEALARLDLRIHDPDFFLTSSDSQAYELARAENPAHAGSKPVDLATARKRWLANGTLG